MYVVFELYYRKLGGDRVLDFLQINTKVIKNQMYVEPDFLVINSTDLMRRGGDFYAIWDEENGVWSTDEFRAITMIDNEILKVKNKMDQTTGVQHKALLLKNASSGMIDRWHRYCQRQLRDNYHPLDEKLIFSNDPVDKLNYASKRLEYPLAKCDTPAWDTLLSTLYSRAERRKIEWTIGAIVTGDSQWIQKFVVFYGSAGTGKSTVMNIIQQLFEGYWSSFDSKRLTSDKDFALEAFKNNPVVAIQHDGDLSRIEDNTKLNSLVSHETMSVNEKNKSIYDKHFKTFIIMGTNRPVKITDGKSGILRRLIDIHPTGNRLPGKEYRKLTKQVKYELGGIAWKCKNVYLRAPDLYDDYVPTGMLGATNDFYNFIEDTSVMFMKNDGVTLKQAWELYKAYADEARVPYPMPRRIVKEELKNYFKEFHKDYILPDGTRVFSYYHKFRKDKLEDYQEKEEESAYNDDWIIFKEQASIFDDECKDCPAQYATQEGVPKKSWDGNSTKLSDIDTRELHYVRVPENHIVIDFDIPDEKGNKSLEKNLQEANKWPATYTEVSKSGQGVHLHYIYTGDINKLNRVYADHIEIKVFTGKSSLRRKLTLCNNLPIATISSGLPLRKEKKKVVDFDHVKDEQHIRNLIKGNLRKEYLPATKPSIDFINKILEDAYDSGVKYDVSDMMNLVSAFAASSTNNAPYCLKLVSKMKFKCKEELNELNIVNEESKLVIFDTEVFPNLFLVVAKIHGEGNPFITLINPKPYEIESLLKNKLVGFNCRKYDNHMLHAALMGYDPEQIYNLSRSIIYDHTGFFGVAYNYSYTDVYDFSSKKQSLKKWEIELDIHHQESGIPWDKPISDDEVEKIIEYCKNDVIATEKVFDHLKGDFQAREILSKLGKKTVNDTTNQLTTNFIVGEEKHPKLVYTDLATGEQVCDDPSVELLPKEKNAFPGYERVYSEKDKKWHNMYRGDDLGSGGWIISWPGIYGNVALLDVRSLHPHSAKAMNYFGKYTERFVRILDARIAIKDGNLEKARKLLPEAEEYLHDESTSKALAKALKIAINSVYGLTSAKFDNPFRDPRNVNNIIALRGALFMRMLQDEVKKRGFDIVAIKTDSIKIADATIEIIDFCMNFARQYGYEFEHECTYDRICQINDADYIAKYKDAEWCQQHYGYVPGENKGHENQWTATGKQFAESYVFKTLFTHEDIQFKDLCQTFSVQKGALYLDMNEELPDVTELEKQKQKLTKRWKDSMPLPEVMDEMVYLDSKITEGHNFIFVGRIGQFCPIKPGCGGGVLYRVNEGKNNAAAGTTGYRWKESEVVRSLKLEDDIDKSYFDTMANKMADEISKYGNFEWFVSDDPYIDVDYDAEGRPIYLDLNRAPIDYKGF